MHARESENRKTSISEFHIPQQRKTNILTNEQRQSSRLNELFQQMTEGSCDIESAINEIIYIHENSNSTYVHNYFLNNFPFELFFKYAMELQDEDIQASAFRSIGYACDSKTFEVNKFINEERLRFILDNLGSANQYVCKASSYILVAIFRQSREMRDFCLECHIIEIIMQKEPQYYLIELLEEILQFELPNQDIINEFITYFSNIIIAMISNEELLCSIGEPVLTTLYNLINNNPESITADVFTVHLFNLINVSYQFPGQYTSILKLLTKTKELSPEYGSILLKSFANEMRSPCIRYTCQLLVIYHEEWHENFDQNLLDFLEKLICSSTWNIHTLTSLIKAYCVLSVDCEYITTQMIQKLASCSELNEAVFEIMTVLLFFFERGNEMKAAISDMESVLEENLCAIVNDDGGNYSQECIALAEELLSKIE